jgi:hypothetical protein
MVWERDISVIKNVTVIQIKTNFTLNKTLEELCMCIHKLIMPQYYTECFI